MVTAKKTAKKRVKTKDTSKKTTSKDVNKKSSSIKTSIKKTSKLKGKGKIATPSKSKKTNAVKSKPNKKVTSRSKVKSGISKKTRTGKKRGRPTNIERRNRLVIDHIYLVKYVSNRLTMKLPPGITKDDILSMGTWGLIDAAKKYNAKRGVLFKTYALTRVRGAIIDELRRHTLGGQALCRKARMLEKAIQAVEETVDSQHVSDTMVANQLGVTEKKLQEMYYDVARSFVLSLDQSNKQDDDSGNHYVDTLQDKKSLDPLTVSERRNIKEIIIKSLKELSEQERKVILMYYYESLNFREIGLVLNVSESRVSQIHTKAIVHMRVKLNKVLLR